MEKKNWLKLGLIFKPKKFEWINSHIQNPFPEYLGKDRYRIYFSSRNKNNQARGGWFEININKPKKILNFSKKPIIESGELGTFDDAGVMPSSIIKFRKKKLMFYTGWSRTLDVPFSTQIGVAELSGKIFVRLSQAPVLGRNFFDPYITNAPYVLSEKKILRMWYVSATKWKKEKRNSKPKHFYTIKHAFSKDGLTWNCSKKLCLPYKNNEYAIARPVVWKERKKYKMWFTYRSDHKSYRIGYASSDDGVNWKRSKDDIGIELSKKGWDSEMICYAHPIFHRDKIYALYNGNNYGEKGVGLALLKGL